jgi:hypothetical protein
VNYTDPTGTVSSNGQISQEEGMALASGHSVHSATGTYSNIPGQGLIYAPDGGHNFNRGNIGSDNGLPAQNNLGKCPDGKEQGAGNNNDLLNRAKNVVNNTLGFLNNNAANIVQIYLGIQAMNFGVQMTMGGIETGLVGAFMSLLLGGEEDISVPAGALATAEVLAGSTITVIGGIVFVNGVANLDFNTFKSKGTSDGASPSNNPIKDASPLNGNKEANKFAQKYGYDDAHQFKADWIKGQKDNTPAHYDIYVNKKTGDVFVVSKNQRTIIQTDISIK